MNKTVTLVYSPVIFAISLFLYVMAGNYDSEIRYLLYITPLVFVFEYVLVTNAIRLNKTTTMLMLYLLATAVYSVIFFDSNSKRELFFLFAVSSVAALNFQCKKTAPIALLLSIGLIIIFIDNTQFVTSSLEIFASSKTDTEHAVGLAVPLLCFYFLHKKKWALVILSVILTYLLAKRISLLGLFLVFLSVLIPNLISKNRIIQKNSTFFLQIFLVFLCLIISLNSALFYELMSSFLERQFNITTNPNILSSGRYNLVLYVDEVTSNNNLFEDFFGLGIGATTKLTFFWHDMLMHNDYKRLLIDCGIFGFTLFIIGAFKLIKQGGLKGMVATYTLILFSTDNVLTYYFYWIILMVVIRSANKQSYGRKNENLNSA